MTEISNVVSLKTDAQTQPLTEMTKTLLNKIAMKIAIGDDLTTAEQSAIYIHFPNIMAQIIASQLYMDALVHRVITSCKQENIDPAAFLGNELTAAG